jgi:hypothetical protein
MPGPGGGGRGGGGFGGGFGGGRGGGFGGRGGFGGGFHGGFYHRPHFYGGFYRRPFFFGGGGCLGGLLGLLFGPIFLIFMAVMLLFSYFGSAVTDVSQGGSVVYNESVFQDYANEQYAREFGSSTAYEDNLLLVFLTGEDARGYCYIAWVGDHIDPQINYLFGSNGTALGNAMNNSINRANYAYSLDSNLAMVVSQMQTKIQSLGLTDSFTCAERHDQVKSHLTNYTDLDMTQSTVDAALESFTAATGIPMVIVVEEMEEVFGKTVSGSSWFGLVVGGVLLLLGISLAVKAFKRRRQNPDDRQDYRENNYDRY